MKIGNYDITQRVIEDYLFAIKWNQSHATEQSDRDQVEAHADVFNSVGLDMYDLDDEGLVFSRNIDTLVENLLIKGY